MTGQAVRWEEHQGRRRPPTWQPPSLQRVIEEQRLG
jgi:hypothetical protein